MLATSRRSRRATRWPSRCRTGRPLQAGFLRSAGSRPPRPGRTARPPRPRGRAGCPDGPNGTVTTVPVTVRLTGPDAAGTLTQGPVTVNITTATARDALAVPVTALLARPGGYVVETAGPGSSRRYVPVTPGIFDDNAGMVEVA